MPKLNSTDPKQEDSLSVLQKQPDVQNIKQNNIMFAFDGAWLPSKDPTLIGPTNFQKLINMRYTDGGIEGVTGYTKVNTTPISNYVNIKNGIHLQTENRTQKNYVVVQAHDSSGNGRLYQNQTDIGSQGDFETTHIHSDSSTNLIGRFSKAPSGNIVYCNGEEVKIWGGNESTVGSVFTTTDSSETLPIDITERIINSRNNSDQRFTYDQSTRPNLTILTTRAAKGFKFYIHSGNGSASSLTCRYWDGTQYTAVSNPNDGTSSGGAALSQTGVFSFDDTVGNVKLHHFEERYLFAYQFELSAGSAVIYEITADYGIQTPTNVWDGIFRTPIQAQVYTAADTAWEDFSLHVGEASTVGIPVGCILDGFVATNDRLILMFEEKMSAIKMIMLGNLINKIGSTATLKYWDGDTFTSVGSTFNDGTSENSATFAKTGLISWNPPSDEEKTTLFGTSGYAYEITVDTTLTGTKGSTEEVVIDIISGVPAIQDIKTYKFPIQYKTKLMLACYNEGNEGNRVDYSEDNAPDIFNGENSSVDGYQSIYVGGTESLTAGAQLYNRFGSNLFSSLILFKVKELYLLTGDGPLDYRLFPVSTTIGCPAPHTLATAEVGFELSEDVARNVAMWVSNSGPMMFDGATLKPMAGLEDYFDPNESVSVNFDVLDTAQGWFDNTYKEYNILIATGENQTTLNTWLVYDIVRKKWFKKDTGTGDPVQSGFSVSDDNGDQYIYAGSLTGTLYQLENGPSWSDSPITNVIQTGDFFPSKSEWDITRIRYLKFVSRRITESNAYVNMYYLSNTDDDGGLNVTFRDITSILANSGNEGSSFIDVTTSLSNSSNEGVIWSSQPAQTLDLSISSGLNRLTRTTLAMNQTAWCHSFKFEFTTSETEKGVEPIMWGIIWEHVRRDDEDL